eukprot:2587580-Pyramimonas_sp.AAC.1
MSYIILAHLRIFCFWPRRSTTSKHPNLHLCRAGLLQGQIKPFVFCPANLPQGHPQARPKAPAEHPQGIRRNYVRALALS